MPSKQVNPFRAMLEKLRIRIINSVEDRSRKRADMIEEQFYAVDQSLTSLAEIVEKEKKGCEEHNDINQKEEICDYCCDATVWNESIDHIVKLIKSS